MRYRGTCCQPRQCHSFSSYLDPLFLTNYLLNCRICYMYVMLVVGALHRYRPHNKQSIQPTTHNTSVVICVGRNMVCWVDGQAVSSMGPNIHVEHSNMYIRYWIQYVQFIQYEHNRSNTSNMYNLQIKQDGYKKIPTWRPHNIRETESTTRHTSVLMYDSGVAWTSGG